MVICSRLHNCDITNNHIYLNCDGLIIKTAVIDSSLHGAFSAIPARLAAIMAALTVTAINAAGIRRSVHVTEVVVILSISSLVAVVILGLPHGNHANFDATI